MTDMPTLIVNIGILVGTLAAAAVAWWQAIEAGRRKTDAETASKDAAKSRKAAVDAQQRAASALAEANALAAEALTVQRAALPPVWSAVELLGEGTVGFRNQSSRAIIVTSIEVEPDEAAPFIAANPRPLRVDYGDVLPIRLRPRFSSPTPRSLIIGWHYEDDPDGSGQATTRQM